MLVTSTTGIRSHSFTPCPGFSNTAALLAYLGLGLTCIRYSPRWLTYTTGGIAFNLGRI